MWIDVHTHLDKLEVSPEETIAQARSVGIERLITIGTEPADHQVVLNLAEKYAPYVFCTLGVHPHEAAIYTDDVEKFILENANHPRVLAVGEIGLDYYYNNSEPKVQIETFRRQMLLAERLNLPVEIHARDADEDMVRILREFQGRVKGLLHCFTGTNELAAKALEYGYNLSLSGVITFKNAERLRSLIQTLPSDRIHVETDAPYLAPIPYRGKPNTSAYMIETAKIVAVCRNQSLEELRDQTWANACKLFPKLN